MREVPVVEHSTVSIQESTTGALTQFMEREACECLPSIKLLSFLAGALQRYEEEGVVLNPKVLLCNSIDELSRSFPGGRFVIIGEIEFRNDSGKRILKQCATLARMGWTIFVERSSNGAVARFGVLSFLQSPTSIELRDMVTLGRDPSLSKPAFAVLVEQIDPKTVLFSGARGNTLRIAFSTTRTLKDDARELQQFGSLCCSKLDNDDFKSFLFSLLRRALNESHGTILVCRSGDPITKVKGMDNAILLKPPLDLLDAFMAYKTLSNANSILELQRSEALLIGMLQSDGIVVFDDQGAVTAYRVFFRQKHSGSTSQGRGGSRRGLNNTPTPVGGARRIAFEGLKALVGPELRGTLFRSQDGGTEFKGA